MCIRIHIYTHSNTFSPSAKQLQRVKSSMRTSKSAPPWRPEWRQRRQQWAREALKLTTDSEGMRTSAGRGQWISNLRVLLLPPFGPSKTRA